MRVKTYIINLERSVTRRDNIIHEVERHGLTYELIQAVDGSALTDEEITNLPLSDYVREMPEYYTKGVLGAALSHIKIYRRIIEDGTDLALVLEDDAKLESDFASIVGQIGSKIATNEIVLLHYMSFSPVLLSKGGYEKLSDGFGLYYPVDFSRVNSGAGYLITREAAKTLLNIVEPIKCEADSWHAFYCEKGFESLRFVYPMPVKVRGEKSTIATDYQSGLRSKLTGVINDFKIPPFYQILRRARLRSIGARSEVRFTDLGSSIQRQADKDE